MHEPPRQSETMEARSLILCQGSSLLRIEVQGGVKEDNNIELPLRGIFHIFGASPPPFPPYSLCLYMRDLLFVRPLNSAPFRFLRSFSRSTASEQSSAVARTFEERHGVSSRTKSSFTKPIARAKSRRGSMPSSRHLFKGREREMYRRFKRSLIKYFIRIF